MNHRVVLVLPFLILFGCAHAPASRPVGPTTSFVSEIALSEPIYLDTVFARVDPPAGWRADPLKASANHQHQVWISPGGHTAYGVIHFTLPLPIGHEWTLAAFLQNMKNAEGEARLVSKQWDDSLPGLRFVAEGGLYRVRTNLQVRGTQGWAVYAGTIRKEPIDEAELAVAEAARERTVVGKMQ